MGKSFSFLFLISFYGFIRKLFIDCGTNSPYIIKEDLQFIYFSL